jgi:peptidoglycan/LPS O-acetylase OafA/YrhL
VPRSPALEPPPANPRFPLADSIRGLAVLAVIFCHSAGFSGAFHSASWGWATFYAGMGGVSVFFALSGFLLYRPFVAAHAGIRRAPSIGSYLRRRALRILPAYWVALTLLAVWPGISGPFTSHWWVYYGFGQVYSHYYIAHGLGVAWSLCVEVSFYLLLPVIAAGVARAVTRFGGRHWWRVELAALASLAAVGIAGWALVQTGSLPTWGANTLVCYIDVFAGGMALAVASVAIERGGRLPRRVESACRRSWMWWLAAALGVFVAHRAFDMYHLDNLHQPPAPLSDVLACQLLLAIAAALVLVPAVFGSGGAIRRLLSTRALGFVGLVSYGMYLWHHPLQAWLANFHAAGLPTTQGPAIQHWVGGHQITLVLTVATVGVSLAIATVSYYVVELPFLRRKERRRRQPRVVPALAAADAEA